MKTCSMIIWKRLKHYMYKMIVADAMLLNYSSVKEGMFKVSFFTICYVKCSWKFNSWFYFLKLFIIKKEPGKFKLPNKRKGTAPVEYLYRMSVVRLIFWGIFAYVFIACIFSIVEYFLHSPMTYLRGEPRSLGFWELMYFNLLLFLPLGMVISLPRDMLEYYQ